MLKDYRSITSINERADKLVEFISNTEVHIIEDCEEQCTEKRTNKTTRRKSA